MSERVPVYLNENGPAKSQLEKRRHSVRTKLDKFHQLFLGYSRSRSEKIAKSILHSARVSAGKICLVIEEEQELPVAFKTSHKLIAEWNKLWADSNVLLPTALPNYLHEEMEKRKML